MTDRYLGAFSRIDPGYLPGTRFPSTNPAAPTQGAKAECPPPCPACGGLQCLCRPRFFSGQLLTDEDLNRLDRYIVEKNKLHNRYLHGWGVVCGLEVGCDPCDKGSVTVKTGYALAPCGEDIVVCDDRSVNICDLINQCRPTSDPCVNPLGSNSSSVNRGDCPDGIERWVLAICYQESPSRGITPLRGDSGSACSSGCNCGGSGSCNCKQKGGSCGNANSTATSKISSNKSSKQYKPQCEPTLVCEGFQFKAYRAPALSKKRDGSYAQYGAASLLQDNYQNWGPLVTRLVSCYLRLNEIEEALNNNQSAPENVGGVAVLTTYSEILEQLKEFATEHSSHQCEIMRELLSIEGELPRLGGREAVIGLRGYLNLSEMKVNVIAINTRITQLLLILLQDCACSALLPPCPDPVGSDCVPLAVVTVRKSDCSVLSICNWEERKFAVTLPNLYYWFSWLPWNKLREFAQNLCCKAESSGHTAMFARLLAVITQTGSKSIVGSKVEPAKTLNSTSASSAVMDTMPAKEKITGNINTAELAIPGLFQLIHQASAPQGLEALLGPWVGSATGAVLDTGASVGVTELHQEVAAMRTEMQALQKTVAAQETVIKRLQGNGK